MTEPEIRQFRAADDYAIHVAVWRPQGATRGRVVVLHGVQSHGGWYHNLGRVLAEAGYETHFPDRRGSGANTSDRGHTPSYRRLVDDVVEYLGQLRGSSGGRPIALGGISWGGKLAVLAAGWRPDLVDALALICPGLHPRVGVSLRERSRIAWAYFTNRRRPFPIPLSDPALFTANPRGQAFIAGDGLGLREATAGLLAASTLIDRAVARVPAKIHQPALLMLAGNDRIIDNTQTLSYFERLASPNRRVINYPQGHHTLEFEADPSHYARDFCGWLDEVFANHNAGGSSERGEKANPGSRQSVRDKGTNA